MARGHITPTTHTHTDTQTNVQPLSVSLRPHNFKTKGLWILQYPTWSLSDVLPVSAVGVVVVMGTHAGL